jgi:ribosomal protein S18 acetylase RimI-like enzyme
MDEIEIIEVFDSRLINTVVLLAKEIWTEHFTVIIGKAQVDYMLEKFQSEGAITQQIKNKGFLYYLLKLDKNYIGYMSIVPNKSSGELLLSKIYVKADERQKGYGKKALQFVEKLAKQRKLNRITLTVNKNNTSSIEAYLKMGFKNVGSVVTDIGAGFVMDDYRMEKFLPGNCCCLHLRPDRLQ